MLIPSCSEEVREDRLGMEFENLNNWISIPDFSENSVLHEPGQELLKAQSLSARARVHRHVHTQVYTPQTQTSIILLCTCRASGLKLNMRFPVYLSSLQCLHCNDLICLEQQTTHGVGREISNCLYVLPIYIPLAAHRTWLTSSRCPAVMFSRLVMIGRGLLSLYGIPEGT